jgi:hypothetical protein
MRIRRFTRVLTAVFMALTLAATVDLSPAAAAAKPAAVKPAAVKPAAVKPNIDPATIAAIIKQLYSYYQQYFGAKSLTLADATQAIINAINAAQTNIIDQIDAVASAQAHACAESAVLNAHDIPLFSTDTLQAFANDTTSCVALIDSLIPTVSNDKPAVDSLGYALGLIAPIALDARSYAGFSTDALRSTLINANNAVMNTLTPSCEIPGWNDVATGIWTNYYDVTDPNYLLDGTNIGDTIGWVVYCSDYKNYTVYKGYTTLWPDMPGPDPDLALLAGVNTSYDVTVADLATLQSL